MARELASYGWRSEGYHAGKLALERQRVQGDFMAGKLEVVVATVAFGLGVNKSDVRLVVHAGLPRSIEAWVQETGRAGRDGLPAQCVALVCEEDYRRLHSQCHRDGIGHEQLKRMLAQIMRGARNGYGELPHKQLETKLDMTREVAETILALLTDLPPSAWRAPQEEAEEEAGGEEGEGEEEEEQEALEKAKAAEAAACARAFAQDEEDARAAAEGPLIALLPDIRRVALLSFHQKDSPAEVVAERSPLVANLLKYAKLTNGSYRCPLVQSAAELSLDAHDAHAELAQLHACGVLRLSLEDSAFYLRVRRVPTPRELDTLTAHLMRRVDGVEQLATTKLKASATMLWTLAKAAKASPPAGGAALRAEEEQEEQAGPTMQELLAAYFLDDMGGGFDGEESVGGLEIDCNAKALERRCVGGGGSIGGNLVSSGGSIVGSGRVANGGRLWAVAPFKPRPTPFTLRSDVLDFVATHLDDTGRSRAPLTGRAVARIFHRLPSPSFPKKDWEKNRFWGMHREVDFEVLRRLADENIETMRRRQMQATNKQPVVGRKRAR